MRCHFPRLASAVLPAVAAAAFSVIMSLASCSGHRDKQEIVSPDTECGTSIEGYEGIFGFSRDSLVMTEGTVKNGQFFSSIMTSLGLSSKETYDLTQACDSVFDVRTLRVGNTYRAYYSCARTDSQSDGSSAEDCQKLEYLVYETGKSSGIVFDCRPPYRVWTYEKPTETVSRYADVTIKSSLWNDMRAAGVSPLLILSLSDIYAWSIDFFGLQKGDRFRVLYDERLCDGELISVDTVRYAVFTHAGEDLPMIMFNQKDGGNIWWNDKGESMRKAFLKAPLKYSRISSGFSYSRRHPVTRKVQPHTGVDYAAPAGTPVMSIGEGVVTSCKNEGAGGNTVRIKHNSVYSTAYLHLSRYASGIKAGKRVHQGEVIGYVGSTGRSTGPHLDFRVWKNGSPVNPLKMESPPAEPLKSENMPAFEAMKTSCRARIDTLQARAIAAELLELL